MIVRDRIDPYATVTRTQADERYRHIVLAAGAAGWRRRAAHTSVRFAGARAWGALPPKRTHPRAYRAAV